MLFDPALPYDDLPPLPPTVDVETKVVLRQALSITVDNWAHPGDS
ncbi:MAG: hypothetical protein NTX88_12030 [Candidatus Atribacteria bacterium]|nr:hypothetical protein [Candidatus Atribacteria bacterium]